MSPAGTDYAAKIASAGWCRFEHDPALAEWVRYARPEAQACVRSPANDRWWRHGRTWFVGVEVLPNDGDGRLDGGPPLSGSAVEFIRNGLHPPGPFTVERAQVSVVHAGYPGRDADESASAHAYRRRRDAAHLDGLLAEGPERRRFLREYHAFVFGIPLTGSRGSPLVVWEGSHLLIRSFLTEALASIDPLHWRDIDLTDAYKAVRERIFRTCPRRRVGGTPGESFLLHRFVLHGIEPWDQSATTGEPERMIAYFRPQVPPVPRFLELP